MRALVSPVANAVAQSVAYGVTGRGGSAPILYGGISVTNPSIITITNTSHPSVFAGGGTVPVNTVDHVSAGGLDWMSVQGPAVASDRPIATVSWQSVGALVFYGVPFWTDPNNPTSNFGRVFRTSDSQQSISCFDGGYGAERLGASGIAAVEDTPNAFLYAWDGVNEHVRIDDFSAQGAYTTIPSSAIGLGNAPLQDRQFDGILTGVLLDFVPDATQWAQIRGEFAAAWAQVDLA